MNKILIVLVVVAALSLSITGCKKKTGEAVNNAATTTGEAVGDAATATGEAVGNAAKATGNAVGNAAKATGKAVGNAAEATGDYLFQNKDEAIKTSQEKIVLLNEKWQELRDKAAPTTDEAKAELQKAKDQMDKTLAEAKTKLIEAKDASDDVWQKDIKPAIDAALDKAQKLYEDMTAKFGSN